MRLHWRRLRSAPSVYVASSAALLRLLQALLFAAATLLALVALPLDPGCMGDAPLATMARAPAGAAAVAVGVAPALLALALLAYIVPHYGVVADVGLAVNAEVLERLKGGQSDDALLAVEEGEGESRRRGSLAKAVYRRLNSQASSFKRLAPHVSMARACSLKHAFGINAFHCQDRTDRHKFTSSTHVLDAAASW